MPLVPIVIERSGREERAMDIYSRLLQDRIIILGSTIDDTVANLVVAQMLVLAHQDAKADIHLYVNSPGGSVTAGLAIYDTMQWVSCDVATYCIGQCASMGSLLVVRRGQGQAQRPAAQPDHDPPAAGGHGRNRDRDPDPRGRIHPHEEAAQPDLSEAHRADARKAPGRYRPRPVHVARGSPGLWSDR